MRDAPGLSSRRAENSGVLRPAPCAPRLGGRRGCLPCGRQGAPEGRGACSTCAEARLLRARWSCVGGDAASSRGAARVPRAEAGKRGARGAGAGGGSRVRVSRSSRRRDRLAARGSGLRPPRLLPLPPRGETRRVGTAGGCLHLAPGSQEEEEPFLGPGKARRRGVNRLPSG